MAYDNNASKSGKGANFLADTQMQVQLASFTTVGGTQVAHGAMLIRPMAPRGTVGGMEVHHRIFCWYADS